MDDDLLDEATYDQVRTRQLLAGHPLDIGVSRRQLLRLAGALGLATALPLTQSPSAAADISGPIFKPLPPDLFTVFGSNAEMRWEAMRGQGYLVPIDRFFVRDHTRSIMVDATTWRLKVFGTGLHGTPTIDNAVEFSYRDLLELPSDTITAFVECAGNGRSFFATQENQPAAGTQWRLGAIGTARWRGVRLETVLRSAGLTNNAVDILPQGLDPDFVNAGVNLGPVRRPIPIQKALHDTLLAYEMNGQPLPPDHGFPVRLIVPDWAGIASIKWLGQIEVANAPLTSPYNTVLYRLFGPTYPADGTPITRQVIKTAFELPWGGTLPSGREHLLYGRSWSGNGPVSHVEVSTDGGLTWRRTLPLGSTNGSGWQRWLIPWRPQAPGAYSLRARATDTTGATQPDVVPFNTGGYLFGGVVGHPVTAT